MMMRLLLSVWLACQALVTLEAQELAEVKRTEDLIYARKFGTALTLDVFQPSKPNGAGIVFVVSGGYFSSHEGINPGYYRAFLKRGYTVFAVVHGSQPRFVIPEIVEDIHRAVRYIRHHAPKYGVDADRLGITGASAGGHLSLTMGTQGGVGKKEARDPIDRESSAVRAVACFFPPTDFLNFGKEGEDAVGVGILAGFKSAFGSRADAAESRQVYGREISPVNYITAGMAPTLIIHGDADKLVPIQQAQRFVEKAKAAGVRDVKLEVREGKEHGWANIAEDLEHFADWFDAHMKPRAASR